MALEEIKEYQATKHGIASFAIKEYTVILKDGVEFTRTKPHTKAVNPGDDLSEYPEEIQGMCNGYWTEGIKKKYLKIKKEDKEE